MLDVNSILTELRTERQKYDTLIAALEPLTNGKRTKHKFSAEHRRNLALAQRRRWKERKKAK